jgi:hypothetical protein
MIVNISEIQPDGGILRGQGICFNVRAVNLNGYSAFDNGTGGLTWLGYSQFAVRRPEQVNVEFVNNQLNVTWINQATNPLQHITGYEVYVSYARSSLSAFEDFNMFPYTLIYTGSGDVNTEGLLIDFTSPDSIMDGDTQLNEYMLIKVVAFNEIKRSEKTMSDRTDVGIKLKLPSTPLNLVGVFDDNSGVGGDSFNLLTWTKNNGTHTNVEVYGKWGGGAYQLLGTVSGSGFNHNVGLNPVGTYYYKIRAVNDSGNSEYTDEITSGPLLPPILSMGTPYQSAPEQPIYFPLSWTSVPGATHYKFYQSHLGGDYIFYEIKPGPSLSYNLVLYNSNIGTHNTAITAYKSSGGLESGYSNSFSYEILQPSTPSFNITYSHRSGSYYYFDFNWSVPDDTSTIRLYRKLDGVWSEYAAYSYINYPNGAQRIVYPGDIQEFRITRTSHTMPYNGESLPSSSYSVPPFEPYPIVTATAEPSGQYNIFTVTADKGTVGEPYDFYYGVAPFFLIAENSYSHTILASYEEVDIYVDVVWQDSLYGVQIATVVAHWPLQ